MNSDQNIFDRDGSDGIGIYFEKHASHLRVKSYPHPNLWSDSLSIVFLGIQTALKEDVCCSRAYGTTLLLPGQFF